jgi:hypothetical protein
VFLIGGQIPADDICPRPLLTLIIDELEDPGSLSLRHLSHLPRDPQAHLDLLDRHLMSQQMHIVDPGEEPDHLEI